jgi:diamine N-acetyltransferase
MHSGTHIRHGRLDDAENLAALAMQVWLHTYATDGISSTISAYVFSEFTAARFATRLADDSLVFAVAEIDAKLVGYACINLGSNCPSPTDSTAELATLYVQAPFIGKGVGAPLLQRAEEEARHAAGDGLWLKVNAQNARAIAFYSKHGYTKIGITHFHLGAGQYENLVLVGPRASR